MRITFTESATKHYSAAVAFEVMGAVEGRMAVGRPRVVMWKADSHEAVAEQDKRPAGRTGPIEIVVYAEQRAADHLIVFHCFRRRAKDVALWTASAPSVGGR
jgi:hypothetical protein